MTVKADEYADLRTMQFKPSVIEIKSHHVFEHFSYVESLAILAKWTLALADKGTIVLGVPDVGRLGKALQHLSAPKTAAVIRLLYGSQNDPWAYHINGWTQNLLQFVLELFGYRIVSTTAHGNAKDDFPNCWICCTAKKTQNLSKSELTQCSISFLKNYVVLPQQKKLYDLLCAQLEAKFEGWVC